MSKASDQVAQDLYSLGAMAHIKSESPTYKLETRLGEGLSSCVYKAERLDSRGHSKQQVVLKILKNKNHVEWLRQEFEALSKIDSSFCVRMIAWENLELGPALVLEYIDGITLYELLNSEKLEEDIIGEIVAQIQRALICLDQAGRYHGDLNLKNIMVDKTGHLKLIDFTTSLIGASASKEILGTPPYLAPEIWEGKERSIKSDLFALGLIELDLRNGLGQVPKDQESCRLRAQSLVNSDLYFLNAKTAERRFKSLERNLSAQKQLGRIVSSILKQASLPIQQTLALNLVSSSKKASKMAVLSILVISCFVTPVISNPLPGTDTSNIKERSGSIEVRTKKWVNIKIDGQDYGYAPIIISKIKAGKHHLSWDNSKGRGEMSLKLESGELRILKDQDFAIGKKSK